MVFVGMLPLSLFMFGSVGAKRSFYKQPLAAFCGIAVLVYVVFFSVSSTKLPNYPMPCYPMLSIVIGLWLAQHIQPSGKVPWYFWAVVLVVALALPVGAYFALNLEVLTRQIAPLAWFILVLPLGIAAALILYLRMRLAKAAIMFVISYTFFNFLALDVLYPRVYKQNIVSLVLESISPAQVEFVAYKLYNPAFNFNLPSEKCLIPVYNHPDSLRAGLAARQANGANGTLYIISRQESIGQLDSIRYDSVIAGKDIFELPTTILLKWRP
jgi:4-amino-4-deoxy-L-arabinose transferase-like glycosyltransferase